ncbi:MFS transporter [Homoserinibacter sp. YIM 151385]|uniref:MFS transporter n=1 Tax=Homoserinibacter sp. YIM 151385 TaxID=2985506 RepID=UPI0022F0380D|nr:MFS transporter [Homoserinibacter sp. YIM 151385]WBU37193.1 MFS transporter [Homoserinibacter sp. YIM 151385]
MTSTTTTRTATWRNAVFAVFALNGIAMASWVSRVPGIRDHLGIDAGQVGLLLLGVSVGSILGLALSSQIVHRLGSRRTLVLTVPGLAVGLVVLGVGAELLESYPVAWAGFAIFGFMTGLWDVAMNVEGAAVERVLDRNIMPWFHAAWSLGTVSGAGIGALAAGPVGIGVFWHLLGAAVLVLIAGPLALRGIPRHEDAVEDADAPALTLRDRLAIWVEPRTLLIGLIMLGMAFTEGSANDWLALAMVDERGVSHGTGALLFGVFTAAMTLGRIAGVPLLDRFGRIPVLRGAGLTAIVGLALVIWVDSLPVTVIGIVLWGIGASLGFPVGMSAAADDPRKAAARVSAVATVAYTAFLVGPPVLGFLGDHVGILNALIVVLALITLALVATPAAREQGAGLGASRRPPAK